MLRAAVLTAVTTAFLCLPAASLIAQPQSNPRPAPRYTQPRQQSARPNERAPQYQNRAPQQYPNRVPQQYPGRVQGYPGQTAQPYRPGQVSRPVQNPYAPQTGGRNLEPNRSYNAPGYTRPVTPGPPRQLYAPPGHLGAWLDTHRNVSVPQQQQMLRSDPSFRRLPQGEQQRVINQLNQVNRLPDAQRERRLARAENLERLSPEDRAHVAQSARQWSALPSERQSMMRNAFRDLKAVPPDQRSIVLNSSRYQGQFSPQERGILSNMLRVEPYAPPQ